MAAGDGNFRKNFGDEFGKDMKKFHAELLFRNLQHWKALFQILITDFEPTAEEQHRFEDHLETIRQIHNEMDETVTIDIIARVKSFGETIYHELDSFLKDPIITSYPSRYETLNKALHDVNNLEEQDGKRFQAKLYNRYHAMYQAIPFEELIGNSEYTQIDEIMKRVLDADSSRSADMDYILEYASIFQLVGDFFNIPEYKEMCVAK